MRKLGVSGVFVLGGLALGAASTAGCGDSEGGTGLGGEAGDEGEGGTGASNAGAGGTFVGGAGSGGARTGGGGGAVAGASGGAATGGAGGSDAGGRGGAAAEGSGGAEAGATGGALTGGSGPGGTGAGGASLGGSTAVGATGGRTNGGTDSGGGGGGASGGSSGAPPTACAGLEPIAEPAEALYVAPDGDDGASGTEDDPLATLSEAAERMATGGTIIVRGGGYPHQPPFEALGTAANPLVIRAASGETPVFDGSGVTAEGVGVIQLDRAEHVVLMGLEIANCLADRCRGIGQWQPILDLTIRDCHIHHMSGPAARFFGEGLRIEANHFHDVALANEDNIAFPGGGWPTCTGTVPDGDFNADQPWTDDVVIRDNVIENCWGEGIGLWYGSNAIVEGNVVENAWNVGIYLDNAFNIRVERNYVHMTRGNNDNGGTGILMGSEVYDLPSASSHDIHIANNVIVAGRGIGWWNASRSYGPLTIQHNTMVAELGLNIGAADEAPGECVARNNVFAEENESVIGDLDAWQLEQNAWLNRPLPSVAGGTDVSITTSVPTVTSATDVQPLALVVGSGAGGTGVTTDFLCAGRDEAAPTRGAFEE